MLHNRLALRPNPILAYQFEQDHFPKRPESNKNNGNEDISPQDTSASFEQILQQYL